MHTETTQRTIRPPFAGAAGRLIGVVVVVAAIGACNDLGPGGTGSTRMVDHVGLAIPGTSGAGADFQGGGGSGE
jgi:hypothetical protein